MAHHFTKSVKKGSRCNVPLLRVCYIVNFSPSFFCLNCCVMMQKWNKILGLAIVTDLFIHSNRVQPIRMPNRWKLKANLPLVHLCSFIFSVYVDMGLASTNPITLTVVSSGNSFSRSFSIKVTQIECTSLSKGIALRHVSIRLFSFDKLFGEKK